MSSFRAWLLCISCLVCSAALAPAADQVASVEWPQWRGPHRDGISTETGLLKEWPKDGPELVWKADGLGHGFSSVAAVGGKIFTIGDKDGKQHVVAVTAAGKPGWSVPFAEADNHGYPGSRCTPTADGDALYVVGSHGDVACLAQSDGAIRWTRNLVKEFGGKMHSGWGFAESPLVDGDRLVCTPGGKAAMLVALNKKTGETIWKSAMPDLGKQGGDGAGYSSIVISNGAGVKQYVQLVGRGVIGVRADDGKFLWGYNRIAGSTANITTPVVSGDLVFATTGYGDGGSGLVKLVRDGDGVKAEEQYYLDEKKFKNHHGGVILVGDYLYGGHGQNKGEPTCLEFKTGKIVWLEKKTPGSGSAAVAYADGNLYFRYQDGTMALIAAAPEAYQLRGTFKVPQAGSGKREPSWPHPVIADGRLLLREQDVLYSYKLK